ncbi:serpin family protein [Candidatus Poribacteria bacterium]|nr:serpin family protein [Candidatus Poribacteria bacterium]
MSKQRNHLILIGSIGIALLCLWGCFDIDFVRDIIGDALETSEDSDVSSVTSANTRFGFKLLHDLRERDPGGNIFISPLSISIALTMTYNGAVGETERAMAEVLEIDALDFSTINNSNKALRNSLENPDPKVEISIANSIWSRQGVDFNPEFLERNRVFFGAEIASLDFSSPQATETINEWVKTNTNGKIEKIIDRINPQTLLFLINAIYFKGNWQDEFNKSRTRTGVFHLTNGSEKQVQMMRREGEYPYLRGENFEATSLPYGDGRVSMYIFLPNRDSNLNKFLGNLNAENWKGWISQFQDRRQTMMLPRFKLEYEVGLNDTLEALGMGIAFGDGADFSNMGPSLFISEVTHKTFVEVNEEGTEAAAVTAVVGVTSVPPVFRVDRPFFFAIYDAETEAILFMGIVTEPM